MSNKKLTSTGGGNGIGRGNYHGQYDKFKHFCTECHTHGNKPHDKDCSKPKMVLIPTYAQLPKKNSSKKKWDLFKKKFIDKVFLKEFLSDKEQKDNKKWKNPKSIFTFSKKKTKFLKKKEKLING